MKRKSRWIALALAAVMVVTIVVLMARELAKKDEEAKDDNTSVVPVSPLTGVRFEKGPPDNPVFVVKVENTADGAPQYGLSDAELVVEEMVEGGVTRLAAFYHSSLPEKVGHVRSLRGTDASVVASVDGQLVASGGADETITVLERAGVDYFSEDDGAPGFSDDDAKERPFNRLVDLSALAEEAGKSDIPGPYFAFSPAGQEIAPAAGARPVTEASVTFSPSHTTRLVYADGRWTRVDDLAAEGEAFAAENLVVVYAPVVDAGYTDSEGNPVPETQFVGSGQGVVVIGGQAVEVTWTKDVASSTVFFADADGASVTLPAGKTWVELVPDGTGSAELR
ncbi:MAG: DUF3048 domain-containing protein [Aeromicrobium sp.]|uniref:DUF3048 domain-containing protein n=1 Tax=Aeromicrobium sp. TaxID=1871063 RepID=UPI0039E307CC